MENQIKSLEELVQALRLLPGIGPRSAQKLAMAVVHMPTIKVKSLAESLMKVKERVHLCNQCFNLAEGELCNICASNKRDHQVICVVEQPLDLWNLEKAGVFNGVYHVLHGHLNPLDGIGPEDLFIPQLLERLEKNKKIKEVILATNPTVEGETTAMYLEKEIRGLRNDVKVTRLARGLAMGSDIEYVDPMTLKNAFENRS